MPTDDLIRRCPPAVDLPSEDEAARVDEDLCSAFTGQAPHLLRVDQETWNYFVSVMDDPPANDGLTRLMQVPAPWRQE